MNKRFLIPNDTPTVKLDCAEAFKSLTVKEKLYLHWLSRASNDGALICALQLSPESPYIVALLFQLFKDPTFFNAVKNASDISASEFESFCMFAAAALSNLGNFKSFGDTKFVPNVSETVFEKILSKSANYKDIEPLWVKCKEDIFELNVTNQQLSYGNSMYLSRNCSEVDTEKVQKFLDYKNVSVFNTRLIKNGVDSYTILVASTESNSTAETYQQCNYEFKYSDFDKLLGRVNEGLVKAVPFVSNEREKVMLERYVSSFKSGSIDEHKEASRNWVKNKGPTVEYYIGFIENYRDPHGSRAEFEGFVAVVNKERSLKYGRLVEMAPNLLSKLPWGKEFEKPIFLEPDFTSLDIITFGSSDVPSGINIPNYDDIRENDGFKNLDLGNVNSAIPKSVKIPFLRETDVAFFKTWKSKTWDVQTALHELLGHGSGLLFNSNNVPDTMDPVLDVKVQSFYEKGETYDSKFASFSSAYEECRAECVGLVLCTETQVLELFGYHDEEEQLNIVHMNYLQFAYDGLRSLEFYDPVKKSWGQAHMQAAFAIMQVFMEADLKSVAIETTTGESGDFSNVHVTFDRSKIGVCQKAVREFLLKLQVFKSTGNVEAASKMFLKYSTPSDYLISLREAVIANKAPRKLILLPNTRLKSDNEVELLNDYPESAEGLIQSFVDRYRDHPEIMDDLVALADRDNALFKRE